MKYFSMFSGIGGFDLALNRLGQTCVGYSEINKYAIQIYKKNFGEEIQNYGNARDINPEQLKDFDILCGGFPCQSFSIAGQRKGFEDTRGTLFFEIARIAKSKRPRYLFLENVKGLLNHNKGETFSIIIQTIHELGYDVEWGVCNSRYFGVPQNRERVFIIGHLRGTPKPKIFPLRQTMFKDIDKTKPLKMEIHPTLTGAIGRQGSSKEYLHSLKCLNPILKEAAIRRLTPLECERLQGFPDGWTEGISDTQRYKCCGNAVTVNVVEAIGNLILGGNDE